MMKKVMSLEVNACSHYHVYEKALLSEQLVHCITAVVGFMTFNCIQRLTVIIIIIGTS